MDEEVIEASLAKSEAENPVEPLLRRFFPLYFLLAALVTFGYALYDRFQLDGDAVAYMDIGDHLSAHDWPGVVNAYWHPMYPALLSVGHILFHSTLANELRAYYFANFAVFLLGMLAVVCFSDALLRLRSSLAPTANHTSFLLDCYPLRYLAIALVVISSQRELSLGKVRPDALLQALLLLAIAALLAHLATNRLRYAALMGLVFGCAYLTKSVALPLTLVSIAALAIFRWLWLKHRPAQILPAALIGLAAFAAVSGPYIAALSHQKHRLDFGDSGALNYAWYVAGTQRMHLQPYMTSQFGSSEVHLKHPVPELLHSPQVLSYATMPYGTYPDWFDPSYWNDQVKPHFNLHGELSRTKRSLVLILRFLFNHPEPLILLALLLALGARLKLRSRVLPQANPFWLIPVFLGVLIAGIYSVVTIEERYITVAYLLILLTLFAALRQPDSQSESHAHLASPSLRPAASLLAILLAFLAAGESIRTTLEDRRNLSVAGFAHGWDSSPQFAAAEGLRQMGIEPGDTVACIGASACLNNHYWARLAGVRILTEVYDPDTPVYAFLSNLPNRTQVIDTVRATGVRAIVGDFGPIVRVSDANPFFRNWHQLANTPYYAIPLKP
jgi:MFS family permease